jgi:hypothetical protein
MTDWTPEEDEAFNDVEKHSNLGKQILRDMGQPYHFEPKREWVGLTDEEILVKCESVPDYDIGNHDLIQFAKAIEAKLKEKNT